jgi:hypothetical protein
MGQGLPEYYGYGVYALTVYDNALIAGGEFRVYGWDPENSNIARWDGSAWSVVGDGTDRGVFALASYNGELVAGGAFEYAGSTQASYIARWNGTTWSSLPGSAGTPGVDAWVWSLLVHDGELVVGGNFSTAGDTPAGLIAAWNGTGWHALGTGDAAGSEVSTMTAYNGDLIAGGDFSSLGGVPAASIARWDGIAWSPLGAGATGWVNALSTCGTDLIAGEGFGGAGSAIAAWDGSAWRSLGSEPDGGTYALLETADGFYAGGDFLRVGGRASRGIARWLATPPVVGVEPADVSPSGTHLAFVAPNPYRVGAMIRVRGNAGAASATVRIFDVQGRCLQMLPAIERRDTEAVFQWNGRDAAGREVPISTYFVRAESDGEVATGRIVLAR